MRDKKRPPAEPRPLLMRKRRVLEILPSEPSSWECGSSIDDSRASSITPSSDTHCSNSMTPVYGNFVPEKKVIGVDDAEKICFGTIKDVLIQLKWFSKSAISNSIEPGLNHGSHNGNPLRVFRLTFHPKQYCLVQTVPGGENVGVLENRAVKHLTSLALHPLYPITFEAVIEEAIWKDKFTTAMNGGGRSAQCISLEIDACGERHMGDEVGRALGGAGFFLQRPSRLFLPPYENPQCVRLSYSHDPAVLDRVLPLLLDLEKGATSSRGPGDEDDSGTMVNGQELDFEKMLEGVRGAGLSADIRVDPRIVTPLKRHQNEGLDFIIKRESLTMPESQGLWEPLGTQQQVIGYRHAITGAKSRTADDSPGGILADDMGLGKTLTMIAAILGSTDEAREYAAQNHTSEQAIDGSPVPLFLKATLIIVPSELLLSNWMEEIDKHTAKGSIKCFKYHGRERYDIGTKLAELQAQDIVLTTYGTAAADFSKGNGLLVQHRWYRIILDEAHVIRNWSTRQFNAVKAIPGKIRWCVTGTPIQNRLEDLGALVRFLQLPVLHEPAVFRRYICYSSTTGLQGGKKSEKPTDSISRQDSLLNLRLMLGSICLRRPQGILPFRSNTRVIRPCFSEEEERDYQALARRTREALVDAVASERAKAAHTHVLEQFLRLREFCNGISPGGGGLSGSQAGFTSSFSPESIFELMVQEQQQTAAESIDNSCGVCCEHCSVEIDTLEAAAVLTECRRVVCRDNSCSSWYWSQLCGSNGNVPAAGPAALCPFCNAQHRSYNLVADTNIASPKTLRPKVYPTKLLELLKDVRIHVGQTKSIVFSVWKRTLDLVQLLFAENGIKYCRVDGSVSTVKQRKDILTTFQTREEYRVLLMTLGTGAVGLNNLSVASRIYILEPQWNPSVERQAIGRVIRLGQEKEVQIVRFIMKTRYSIEETVEQCQERKLYLASGGLNIAQAVKDHWAG